MTQHLRCPQQFLDDTLTHLRAGGAKQCETVVLWLGNKHEGIREIGEVYRPEQVVDVDYFLIPQEGMRSLMRHLKETRLQVLAQVHSHPEQAYHSKADDTWSIIRHVGAISIVIPFFASTTSKDNFENHAATYQLNDSNRWVEVAFADVVEII